MARDFRTKQIRNSVEKKKNPGMISKINRKSKMKRNG